MNLYFRFFVLMLKRVFVPFRTLGLLDECRTTFFVNILDLDLNFHMNNGRFLSVMDLGRTDLMIRSRTFWPLFGKGYYPVVLSQGIRFRKSLNLFQKFEVRTRMEGWTKMDFYLTQEFWAGGEICAEGFIKGRFRRRGVKTSIPTAEIFEVVQMKEETEKVTDKCGALDGLDRLLVSKSRSNGTVSAP